MAKSNEHSESSNMASYADTTNTDHNNKNNSDTDLKTTDSSPMSGVKPVFALESDVFGILTTPEDRNRSKTFITNTEMYESVCKVASSRTVIGLQRIRGLWRIYLDCESEREQLISKGLEIRNKTIVIYSRNPRVTIHETNTDVRIRVKDVPLSADDGQIVREMESYNCTIVTNFRERLRYDNLLTNCLTGDRIIICNGPLAEDIPRSIKIGKYRATVLYRGQPNNNGRPKQCSKCLQEGHLNRDCHNDWVCKQCGGSGHKQSECTNDTFAENANAEKKSHEEDEDDEETIDDTSDADDEETGNGGDINADDTQQPKMCDTEKTDNVQNSGINDDSVEQSQSILKPVEKKSKKKKKTDKKPNGQSQPNITKFLKEKCDEKENTSTPKKQSGGTNFCKSPVTPTEELHDAHRDSVKRPKTGQN